jgi:hypothetical protein
MEDLINKIKEDLKLLRKVRKDFYGNELHYYNPIEVNQYLEGLLSKEKKKKSQN